METKELESNLEKYEQLTDSTAVCRMINESKDNLIVAPSDTDFFEEAFSSDFYSEIVPQSTPLSDFFSCDLASLCIFKSGKFWLAKLITYNRDGNVINCWSYCASWHVDLLFLIGKDHGLLSSSSSMGELYRIGDLLDEFFEVLDCRVSDFLHFFGGDDD